MPRLRRVLLISAAAISLGLGRVSSSARAASLTLYSAQHEQTVDLLTKAFTKETGIDVKVHSGEAPELASQLVKEGASSSGRRFLHREFARARAALGEGAAGEGDSRDAGQRARRRTAGPPAIGSAFSRAKTCWPSTPA